MIGRRAPARGPDVPVPAGPELNAHVTLLLEGGAPMASRVEDTDGDQLAVAAPEGIAAAAGVTVGACVEVRWPAPHGVYSREFVVSGVARDTVPTWWLTPTSAVQTQQRRAYVRARSSGWPVLVELTWVVPDDGVVSGELVDLSEGGLRVRMPRWDQPDGAAVAVRLTVADASGGEDAAVHVREFDLMGTALRSVPVTDATGRTLGPDAGRWVMVQFHDGSGSDGDALRALVFAWQREARRTGRE